MFGKMKPLAKIVTFVEYTKTLLYWYVRIKAVVFRQSLRPEAYLYEDWENHRQY